jgi:DNA-binding CsgD family transcriptional regulator
VRRDRNDEFLEPVRRRSVRAAGPSASHPGTAHAPATAAAFAAPETESAPERANAAGGPSGPTVSLDPSWRILSWNADAERLFGFPRSEVRGNFLHDVLQMRDSFGNPVACFCGALEAARRGEGVRPFLVEVTTRIGEPLRVVVVASPAPHPGRPSGVVCRFRPDSRRRQVDRRGLEPGTDPLGAGLSREASRSRAPRLSPAELRVLRLLAEGKRADEVARTLCNSVLTVRNHIQKVLRKLDAHTQAQAISVAMRIGLV